jgi:hypothetical protein
VLTKSKKTETFTLSRKLSDLLSEFGEILNVTVGNKHGKSLGYAFVEFKNRSDAEKAFERVLFLLLTYLV